MRLSRSSSSRLRDGEVACAEDGGQQIVEVVGEAAGQLAERLHLLRAEQLLARFLEPQLGLALLGHVAGDLGEADQLAVIVANGVDHHACPETRAVLAHAPAFGFVAAGFPRGLERAFRHAGVDGLRACRNVLKCSPTISSGRVALDALGARIPVGHAAFGIEHVDGVIGDALDQQAEAPLGIEKRLLGIFFVGHVAGDLREADQTAMLVVDAIDDDARPEARAVLPNAPAFTFELAFGARDFKHSRGHTGLPVLIGVKGRKMLPDDLFGLEALDALRAGIPAGHYALRVQHVDRVINDGLDEQPERIVRDHTVHLIVSLPAAHTPPRDRLNT